MEDLLQLLKDWWMFAAILVGALFAIVVVSLIISRVGRRPSRLSSPVEPSPAPPAYTDVAVATTPEPETVEEASEPLVEAPQEAPVPDEATPAAPLSAATDPTTTVPLASTSATTPEAVVATTPDLPVVEEPSVPPAPQPETPKEPKPALGAYHVRFRPADGKWYVSRDGSERILRVLETQAEAIHWATIHALTQDVPLIVHRKDGTVRKP